MSTTPVIDHPYTDGLRQGVVRYQRCTACGQAQTLTRYACVRCGGRDLPWQDSAGWGTVYAVTQVMRAPSDEFRELTPYTLALVDTDEGSRLMAHAEPGAGIGDRVTAEFFVHRGRTLLRFRKARDPSQGNR